MEGATLTDKSNRALDPQTWIIRPHSIEVRFSTRQCIQKVPQEAWYHGNWKICLCMTKPVPHHRHKKPNHIQNITCLILQWEVSPTENWRLTVPGTPAISHCRQTDRGAVKNNQQLTWGAWNRNRESWGHWIVDVIRLRRCISLT